MRIWLIKASEGLPIDGDVRLARTGALAEYLSRSGHDVVWWTSTFRHEIKQHRYTETTNVNVSDFWKLILLYAGCGYAKNVSIARIRYCRKIANRLRTQIEKESVPDVIIVCWPIIELVDVAIKYGRKKGIPVIVDIRDQWPDSFATVTGGWKRKILELILFPMIKKSNRIIAKADSITSMSEAFIEWGCRKAGRERGEKDAFIPIGSKKIEFTDEQREQYKMFWGERGISEETWNLCLISVLTMKNRDIHTVIRAVNELGKKYANIRFVLGGTGDDEDELRKIAGESEHIVFAGWLNEPQMQSLMLLSKCGMYCMKKELFSEGFGNKPIQYLSAGLPIVSSVRGYTEEMISKYKIGLIYEEGDVDSCMNTIERLYLDEKLQKEMSRNATRCFVNQFDSETVNENFEKYIKKVCESYGKDCM